LKGTIKEDYLDLRFEGLPPFYPENIENYRYELRNLLERVYKSFEFNVVALLCYSSFKYINTLEIAYIIKTYINPDIVVVVGGAHPTLCPDDFRRGNLPLHFNNAYPQNSTPIDFVIKEEGEIPFYRLIKRLLNNSIKKRDDLRQPCTILKVENVKNLDELPIISYDLYKKYRENISEFGQISLEFARGCPFRCKMCVNSGSLMGCYQNVRLKSVDKCIAELKAIRDASDWLSVKSIYISDMIFYGGRRSYRNQFFKELRKLKNDEQGFPYHIRVNDRVEICRKSDLENYARLNITPHFGFETGSKTLLKRLGKAHRTEKYLRKVEKIVKNATKLKNEYKGFAPRLNFMIMTPGADLETHEENCDFFLKERFDGKSLVEKFDVNLLIAKYTAYYGHELYDVCESKFGGSIFFKEWWKIFSRDQRSYATFIQPSKDLTVEKALKLESALLNIIFKKQMARKNEFFSFPRFLGLIKKNNQYLESWKEALIEYEIKQKMVSIEN
jgi:radical SAM superfamily enzyme YgiQ (UPF0313 family)